jgi:PKD repeat protein
MEVTNTFPSRHNPINWNAGAKGHHIKPPYRTAMVPKKSLSKVLVVLVAFLVVGGTVVGLVIPALRGEVGGLSSGGSAGSSTPGTQIIAGIANQVGLGFGVTAGASNLDSAPSTTVLGTTVTSTESGYSTATSTSTVANEGSPSTNSTGQASPGGDIEFFSNLTLNVSQSSASLQKAAEIASSLGGYVAYSTYAESLATITVRVPSSNYQDALGQLEALGSIVSASSSSNDVTVQYADLNATLQSLLTEHTSLLKLLSESNSVNATLTIEAVLQQTDAKINAVESSILETGQLIQYATIGINFQTSVPHTSVPLVTKLSATPTSGMSPLSVTFNALVSGGVQPYIVNYNFRDGTSAQGQQLIHQFTQAGRYNVTVSATDQSGNVSLAWIVINVTSPPVASGFAAFGGYVWSLFAGVVEGIIEVAVVVVPIFVVVYLGVLPAYRKISKGRESGQADSGTSKLP